MRSSVDTDKSAGRVYVDGLLFDIGPVGTIRLQKMLWPQNRNHSVIKNDTFWQTACKCMLMFYCNYGYFLGSFLLGYSTISLQKCTFATSPLFNTPSKCPNYIWFGKTRIMGLPEGSNGFTISLSTYRTHITGVLMFW